MMPCLGKLTYRSFMSSVIILLDSLSSILLSSSVTSCEFLVVYVYGRFSGICCFLLRYFAIL